MAFIEPMHRNNPNITYLLTHFNVCLVLCQLKFNICVRCDMAFIEPMHRNKPNITYLLTRHIPEEVSTVGCAISSAINYFCKNSAANVHVSPRFD